MARVNRRGITRTVVLTRRYAIKLPSLRGGSRGPRSFLWSLTSGIQANLSEWEWSGMPGVCPVLFSAWGLVNVYPRCELLADDAVVDYDAIGFPYRTDNKPDNVGYLDGRLVWVDYDMSSENCPSCRSCGSVAAATLA
jgi:hypothetical protein